MAKTKVLQKLNSLFLVRDATGGAPGNTTINGAGAAAGQKVVPVALTNNFAAGDTVRIGSGEDLELGVVASVQAGVSITLADNLTYAHIVGEAVVEQTAYDLGAISGGVNVSASAETSDVAVATQRLAYTTLNGYADLAAEFGLPGITPALLAFAMGIPLSAVTGAGTAASPYQLAVDGNEIGTEQNMSLIAIGVTVDAVPLRVELWGVDMDYTNISMQLRTGQHAPLSCRAVASAGGVATTNASAYVADTSQRPSKLKVFDQVVEFGAFVDTGTQTTHTGALAAAATNLTVASSAGILAGDWVRVDTGDQVEFHRVDTVPDGTHLNLKTPTKYPHLAACAIVKVTPTPFGGISEDGVTFAVGGSVEPIRLGQRRLSAGLKAGAAVMTLSGGIVDHSLSVIARALGIPQAQIANGRLPITGDKIGTDITQGVYFKGLTKETWTQWINLWGASQVVQFAMSLTNEGVQSLPLSFRPNVVHFIQHP